MLIWRDVPVQHFATPKGDYDPASLGKHCQPLQPFYDVRLYRSSHFASLHVSCARLSPAAVLP